MNITEETNDYFKSSTKYPDWYYKQSYSMKLGTLITIPEIIKNCRESDPIKYNSWSDKMIWDSLKDKLKTTPYRGIKKISKIFRIEWSKVFKRGWLLWK